MLDYLLLEVQGYSARTSLDHCPAAKFFSFRFCRSRFWLEVGALSTAGTFGFTSSLEAGFSELS